MQLGGTKCPTDGPSDGGHWPSATTRSNLAGLDLCTCPGTRAHSIIKILKCNYFLIFTYTKPHLKLPNHPEHHSGHVAKPIDAEVVEPVDITSHNAANSISNE